MSSLFTTAEKPEAKGVEAWFDNRWLPRFRGPHETGEALEWDQMRQQLAGVSLSLGRDEVTWMLEPSGDFSSGSL